MITFETIFRGAHIEIEEAYSPCLLGNDKLHLWFNDKICTDIESSLIFLKLTTFVVLSLQFLKMPSLIHIS